ncbi:MAG TPA: hypothetical protein VEH84_11020 [Alphaproteobacteria bacterium]|nr:hypothetical protein [Alphaproteobacteria bacterium]
MTRETSPNPGPSADHNRNTADTHRDQRDQAYPQTQHATPRLGEKGAKDRNPSPDHGVFDEDTRTQDGSPEARTPS